MKDVITNRFRELVAQGQQLVGRINRNDYYVSSHEITPAQAWLSSVSNLLQTASLAGSFFLSESKTLMTHENMKRGIPPEIVSKMLDLLVSAQQEWEGGLMRRIEYILAARDI